MDTKNAIVAKAFIGIKALCNLVFENVINPNEMENYFISFGSDWLEKGKTVTWCFPEFEGSYPVEILDLEAPNKIQFSWDKNSLVNITFIELEPNYTQVLVEESGYQKDDAGIKWAIGQTEGWANFLASLKAWVEHKINIRKGAFDYLNKK